MCDNIADKPSCSMREVMLPCARSNAKCVMRSFVFFLFHHFRVYLRACFVMQRINAGNFPPRPEKICRGEDNDQPQESRVHNR